MPAKALWTATRPSSDCRLSALRHAALHLSDRRSAELWKPAPRHGFRPLKSERAERGAKPMGVGTPRVHADVVDDFTEGRLPSVEHGRKGGHFLGCG
jgi:hypothetical protein